MTTCTERVFLCPLCGGSLCSAIPFVLGFRGTSCVRCYVYFREEPTCDGEIKKVWKNGRLFDCICQKCGKSYGGGYLDGLKIQNSLIGANIRF